MLELTLGDGELAAASRARGRPELRGGGVSGAGAAGVEGRLGRGGRPDGSGAAAAGRLGRVGGWILGAGVARVAAETVAEATGACGGGDGRRENSAA